MQASIENIEHAIHPSRLAMLAASPEEQLEPGEVRETLRTVLKKHNASERSFSDMVSPFFHEASRPRLELESSRAVTRGSQQARLLPSPPQSRSSSERTSGSEKDWLHSQRSPPLSQTTTVASDIAPMPRVKTEPVPAKAHVRHELKSEDAYIKQEVADQEPATCAR